MPVQGSRIGRADTGLIPDFQKIATPQLQEAELRGRGLHSFLFLGGRGAHQAVQIREAGGGGVLGIGELCALLFREVIHRRVGDETEGFSLLIIPVALVLHVLLDGEEEIPAEKLDLRRRAEVLDPLDDLVQDLAEAALRKPDVALVKPPGRGRDRVDQHGPLLEKSLLVVRVKLLPDSVQVVFDQVGVSH